MGRLGFLLERLELSWFGTPGTVLERIGVCMERLGSIIFGTVLGRLGTFLERVESVKGRLEVLLNSRLGLGRLGVLLERFGLSWDAWNRFGAYWGHHGASWKCHGLSVEQFWAVFWAP